LVRSLLPRYRYYQLMQICWKIMLPISLAYYFFIISCIITFQGFF
jgi:NADH:ubiquinone oxidoreductase subunit H